MVKMFLLVLLCLSSVLMKLEASSPGVCKLVTAKTSILQKGKRLNGFQFYNTTVPDFIQCARKCFFRRRCLSFNYDEKSLVCEFNNARVDPPYVVLNTTSDYLYSDIRDWDKAIGMGPCWNQPCGICEACYPTESNYICVKEELTSCQDIKICTNATSDGHYLIRPVVGTKPWLKVYCYEMASNYSKDFLTLHETNFVLYPPYDPYTCGVIKWSLRNIGYTAYQKIRLEVTRLRVMNRDTTFSTISCDPKHFGLTYAPNDVKCLNKWAYGSSGDCQPTSCKPRKGEFLIDLRGTGLVVASTTKWSANGWRGSITSIDRSASNQVVKGLCGGNCGGCSPGVNFILEPKP